jgi:hypothetical protein
MNINVIKTDLLARGFVEGDNGKMEYACGSIAHYTKCTVCLGYRLWGDLAEHWFYSVRYESFAESGQPEFDHHTVTERYIAESNLIGFLRDKGILTDAEIEKRADERRAKLREIRARRGG